MGHLVQWDNEDHTVVLQQYTDNPVKNDLYHLAEDSAGLLKTVPHTVHLIIDERNIKLTFSLADLKYLENNVPPNQGVAVIVVAESALAYKKMIQDMNKKLAPKAFNVAFFVSSLEAARQLLQEQFDVRYP